MSSHSLTRLLCALCAAALVLPGHQSFAIVNSALTAKVHPDSPQECDVSVVEIGAEVGDLWQPQLALVYDTREGLARVRKVFGYFARPGGKRPPEVLNVDAVDRHVGFYLAYRIVKGIVASGIVTAGITTAVDRFAVQPYLTNHKVQVAKAMETIRIYSESPDFAVPGGLGTSPTDFRDEIKRLLVSGDNILQFQKLFVDRTLAPKAWDWSAQTFRSNADRNDTRLSFVLERVGLRGLKRERWGDHFAVLKWHRDELLEVASFLDLVHLDVDTKHIPDHPLTPEEKEQFRLVLTQMASDADADGYVTVAIYDLMNSDSDKVKVIDDVSGPPDLARRKYIQLFHSIGLDFGGTLLAFGPKVLMNIADDGITLFFDKLGVMILYDQLEQSEAGLFAILNSDLWDVTADTRERLRLEGALDRQNINVFIRAEGDAHANRLANAALMTSYLKDHSQDLCDETNRAREADFRDEYLSARERTAARLNDLVAWVPGVPRLDDPEQQGAQIAERLPALEARRTLRLYDPTKFGGPRAPEVAAALTTLAAVRDNRDVTIFGQVLDRTSEVSLMRTVLEAMAMHGDPDLSDPILDWLGHISPRSRYGESSLVTTALETLTALRWPEGTRDNANQFVALRDGVAPFAERGVGDSKELALRVQAIAEEHLRLVSGPFPATIQSP